MSRKDEDWGFTYYKPTYWIVEGKKQYRAKFVRLLGNGDRLETWVDFFSNHPIRALRSMLSRLANGNTMHPTDFQDKKFLLLKDTKAILMA